MLPTPNYETFRTQSNPNYLSELKKFFYENQYDDKYPHFRACDLVSEPDMDGNWYEWYAFHQSAWYPSLFKRRTYKIVKKNKKN